MKKKPWTKNPHRPARRSREFQTPAPGDQAADRDVDMIEQSFSCARCLTGQIKKVDKNKIPKLIKCDYCGKKASRPVGMV